VRRHPGQFPLFFLPVKSTLLRYLHNIFLSRAVILLSFNILYFHLILFLSKGGRSSDPIGKTNHQHGKFGKLGHTEMDIEKSEINIDISGV
jgi:hypothetical protein